MSKNKRPIIYIFNKKFVLYEDPIYLYRKNGQDFLEYQSNVIELDSTPELPQIKGRKPIKIKYYTDVMMVKVEISDIVNYNIKNNYNSKSIRYNGYNSIYIKEDKELKLRFIKNKNVKFTINFKYEINNTEHKETKIKNTINEIYNSDNATENTVVNKNNNYCLDIELLLNLEKIDGVKNIGSGSHRKVFKIEEDNLSFIQDLSGRVIKVAKNKKGIESNEQEFKAWKSSNKNAELNSILCPVTSRGPDYKYIVMKDASISDKSIIDEDVEYIKKKIKKYTDKDSISGQYSLDIRKENIGYINDRLVLLDYPYGGKFINR